MLRAILSNINDAELKSDVTISGEAPLEGVSVELNDLDFSYKKTPVKYISLDGKGIDLNGKGYKFYKTGDYVGYISNSPISESSASVVLNSGFNKKTTKGITLYFWKDYPTSIEITYYKTSPVMEEITTDTYIPDNIVYCCEKAVEDWQVAEIMFYFDTYPTHLKLYDIRLGIVTDFTRFFDFNLLEEINVLSDDLSINSCDFTVDSKKDLISFEGGEVQILKDEANFGFFTLKDCERVYTDKYTLENYDVISKLENSMLDTETFGFVTDITKGEPVLNIIDLISGSSGVEIELDDAFLEYTVFGFLPMCTCRYALTQLCWAIGGMIDSSRNDKVFIKPISTRILSVIRTADKRIIGDALFKKSEIISSIKWSVHNYLLQPSSEEKTLFSLSVEEIVDSSGLYYYEKIWDKPTYVAKAVKTTSGTAFYDAKGTPNWMYFYTDTIGEYDIIGYEYVDSVTEVEILNPDITGSVKENVKTFDNFTLYAKDQNGSYDFKKNQIQNYIRSKGTVTAKIVLKGERVGDLISIETAFSGVITGIIVSMNLSLTYSNVAEIEVLEWGSGMI